MQVIVAPPLYRDRPLWYQQGLAQIAARFSSSLSAAPPSNLRLLPSFLSQDLDPDGVHLTPVSGLHYILHLFDSTVSLLQQVGLDTDARVDLVQESVRQHSDRLAYLENRHGTLASGCTIKFAQDQEFNDWMLNKASEDWMTILGLPRLHCSNDREWQTAIKKQISDLIRLVLKATRSNLNYDIRYVINPIKNRTSGLTVVNVRMDSVETSQRFRVLYSSFFGRNSRVSLPASLKGVSVRNMVTINTRIRIAILQQLGANYKNRNPGSSFKVRGYDPRPQLVVFPAAGASASSGTSGRPRTFNFMDAVQTLPTNLSDENLSKIFQVVGAHHQGALRKYFVILSDDDRDRCQKLVIPRGTVSSSVTASGVITGPSSGMDLSSGVLGSLLLPPPPPPAPPAPSSVASDVSDVSDRRTRHRRSSRSSSPDRRGMRRESPSGGTRRKKKRTRRSSTSSSSTSGSSSDPPKRRHKNKSKKRH